MKDEIKEILDDLRKYANEGGEHKLMEYEIKHIQCYITKLQEENERLNNIINELEKWIKEDKEYAMNNFECGRCFNMCDILNKLKELKEGKSNEQRTSNSNK